MLYLTFASYMLSVTKRSQLVKSFNFFKVFCDQPHFETKISPAASHARRYFSTFLLFPRFLISRSQKIKKFSFKNFDPRRLRLRGFLGCLSFTSSSQPLAEVVCNYTRQDRCQKRKYHIQKPTSSLLYRIGERQQENNNTIYRICK